MILTRISTRLPALALLLASPAFLAAPAIADDPDASSKNTEPSPHFTGADLFGLTVAADPQISPD